MLKNWKKTGQGRAGGPFLGILLLLFIGVGCAAGNSSKEAREAAEAPAWEVEGEDHGILIPVDTVEQFDEKVLKAQNPVVVDFFSPSCGACMLLAPKLERVASEYSGKAGFVKVDVGRAKALVTQYDIFGTPIVLFFANGKEVKRLINPQEEAEIRMALDSFLTK